MDYNAIIQAIGAVGFPIVAACAMFYLYDKTIKELTIAIAKIDVTMEHLLAHIQKQEVDVSK